MKISQPGYIAYSSFMLLVLFCYAGASNAAVVRGMLQRVDPDGTMTPVSGMAVTVSTPEGQRSEAFYSDDRGIYYVPNIDAGPHNLEIWVKSGENPTVFHVDVVEPTTNVAPIKVP
jgi:hypothetical protein